MATSDDDPGSLERPAATVPLERVELSVDDARAVAADLVETMRKRRSVRAFASTPVPRALLLDCLRVAASAPSGANLQPWSFVVVTDPEKKREIRAAAEEEERAFYDGKAPETWLRDLAPFGTGPVKEFLDEAPALIAIFSHPTRDDGRANYYVKESVGIATGFLIMALHQVGLACLTHTPSPMRFLERCLERPANERAYLLMPVGYPAEGVEVPKVERRPIDETVTFVE